MTKPDHNGDGDGFAESLPNVRTAFAWADTHARLGDYEYAIKWLDVGARLGGRPPARVNAKREAWMRALKERQRA
jgi:hypothetical protein